MAELFDLDMDAFSDGQMASKIWLSSKLNDVWGAQVWPRLIIFGSWYGLLPFILKLRNECQFSKLILCDLEQRSLDASEKILNHWICRGLDVQMVCADCNDPPFSISNEDLVINTSSEHMSSLRWWKQLPQGVHFGLQSTDMKHPTHVNSVASLSEWKHQLGMVEKISFEGSLHFSYPDKEFYRWMLLGKK